MVFLFVDLAIALGGRKIGINTFVYLRTIRIGIDIVPEPIKFAFNVLTEVGLNRPTFLIQLLLEQVDENVIQRFAIVSSIQVPGPWVFYSRVNFIFLLVSSISILITGSPTDEYA